MSGTIQWEPVNKKQQYIPTAHTSSFITSMTEAFGEPPWTIGQDEIAILQGMMYASGQEPSYRKILKILTFKDALLAKRSRMRAVISTPPAG